MIFGDSGIIACSPPDRRPDWEATKRRLIWPNGATAQAFSAHEPEALRGPQFDAAWADKLAKWKKADETWDMLQFALRLGEHPQQVITTTPRNVAVLKAILKNPSTVMTHAPTDANRAYTERLHCTCDRQNDICVGRSAVGPDNVEVALHKLAIPSALRVLASPNLGYVVTSEG